MSRQRKQIFWTTLITAALVSITTAAVLRRTSIVSSAPGGSATAKTAPPDQSRKKQRLGYELITLTRFGFEPSQITRRGGHFFLAIENRSATRNLTIRIDPEHGNRVREVVQPADQLDWTDEMKLPPGRYRISTSDQPDRVCHLTITP